MEKVAVLLAKVMVEAFKAESEARANGVDPDEATTGEPDPEPIRLE
jgi:hypothetical protein